MNPQMKQLTQRTDSRPLAERKKSITMRKAEIRAQLDAVERAEAELDIEIEREEYERERAHAAE